MQYISDAYKELNESLHKDSKGFGTSGYLHYGTIMEVFKDFGCQDILDYGCGKNTLANNVPFKIKKYDPCIEKYSYEPAPSDLVVCTDVLEHVEEDKTIELLRHINSLTKKVAFVVINLEKSFKFLSDYRNAHINLHSRRWWTKRLFYFFDIFFLDSSHTSQILFILTPKKEKEKFSKLKINHGDNL